MSKDKIYDNIKSINREIDSLKDRSISKQNKDYNSILGDGINITRSNNWAARGAAGVESARRSLSSYETREISRLNEIKHELSKKLKSS